MTSEMGKAAKKFVDEIAKAIKFQEAQEDVRRELLGHIEDNYKAAKSYGLSDENAIAESIRRMGEPKEIGATLNAIHQPSFDFAILIPVALLCAVGLIALRESGWMGLQLIWMFFGTCIAATAATLPYRKFQFLMISFYPLALVGLFAAHFSGVSFEGQPYLSLFGLRVKMIDFGAVLMAMSLPAVIEKVSNLNWSKLAVASMTLTPVLYFAYIGSTLPAILFLSCGLVAVGQSRLSGWLTSAIAALAIGAIAVLARNPFLTEAQLHLSWAQNGHTDFILATMSKNSAIYSVVVMVSLIGFFMRTFPSAVSVKNDWLRSTAVCGLTIIAIESALGIMSNFGFTPMFTTGINIPFLSYGGSLIIAHMLAVGVVLGCLKRKSILHFV